ncbi:hypothetical protein SAMN02745181_1730 [Rubritalea squalenifaciens DSM 18772]|uniref:Uncharacterized protein n=1 Tax=Rubritalea squalenifaciens DSM 18772 TaxID=1123071 RepID=A0A1M6I9Z1_9BACT|nr:hypothetical protein SAMN02745181_1730 [Rubritalea squalenifaciens DSM 18772]
MNGIPTPSRPTPTCCLLGFLFLFSLTVAVIASAAMIIRASKHGLHDSLAQEFLPFLVGGLACTLLFGFATRRSFKDHF